MTCLVTAAILQQRDLLLDYSELVLALSGGKDSVVLLTALVNADLPVRAIHIHHGLQSVADSWVDFCLDLTSDLGIDCEVKRVQVIKQARRGLEDSAREARYAALWSSVLPKGALLTAHHQRDQAETFLLRLLRGSGVKGLAGMRQSIRHSDERFLERPLLSVSHNAIDDYAHDHQLSWIEDPSNQNIQFKRNEIRHLILPALSSQQQQSPEQVIQILARTCEHLVEASDLLDIMAQEDWQKIAINSISADLSKWRSLPWIRAKQVLSWRWQFLGAKPFAQKQWGQIKQQFYDLSDGLQTGRHSHFVWHGHNLILDTQTLWLLDDTYIANIPRSPVVFGDQPWGRWGLIRVMQVVQQDDECEYYWRMRQAGDGIVIAGQYKKLKDWLQTQDQFPLWQRQRWPVLCNRDDQVIGWANLTGVPNNSLSLSAIIYTVA